MLHTLNVCPARLHLATARHNATDDVLKKVLAAKYPASAGFVLRSDARPDTTYSLSGLRPDECIVAAPRADGSPGPPGPKFAFICDVKGAFPTQGPTAKTPTHNFVIRKDLLNQLKYEDIRRGHARKLGRAVVTTLIIPSTGPTPMLSYTTLVRAGLDKRSICKILREMNIAATKANYAYAATLPTPTRSPTPPNPPQLKPLIPYPVT